MRRRPPKSIQLSRAERTELKRILHDGHTEQRIARRAHILLSMSAPQTSVDDLATQVDYTPTGIWYVCRRFEARGLDTLYTGDRSGRPRGLTALERVQVEQLACCNPLGLGLELTRCSTRSLAAIARERLRRPPLAHSTVSLILREADLQPHRSRYWKTPTLNAEFVERASRVLWCYEQVERLDRREEIVLTLDEQPNLQATERTCPTQRLRAGQLERQEFEYTRQGTVNFVVAMMVYDGTLQGWCLDAHDSEHLGPVLAEFFRSYRDSRRLHLILDKGSSHVSETPRAFLRDYQPWLRVLLTPAHASWLNQSELLLRGFSERYLKRGEWPSRCALIDPLLGSCDEYNRLFACPFAWTWTRRKMHQWVERQTAGLS